MAELSVGADLTGVEGFPTEMSLHHQEDLVARYGSTKEAVATLVPLVDPRRAPPRRCPLGLFYFVMFICLQDMASFILFSW
jgi:hypothetical protein